MPAMLGQIAGGASGQTEVKRVLVLPMTDTFGSEVLAGKVAFVAGGTRGMNLEIARRYAQQGAKVTVLSRNQERVDAAVDELKQLGGEVLGYAGDVRDYD